MQEPISVGQLMEELLAHLEGDPTIQGREERRQDLIKRGRL